MTLFMILMTMRMNEKLKWKMAIIVITVKCCCDAPSFFLHDEYLFIKMVVMINVWNFQMMWVLSLSLCHCHQHYLFMVVAIPLSRSKKDWWFLKRWHLNFYDLMQPKWSKMKYVMMSFDVLFNRYAIKNQQFLKNTYFSFLIHVIMIFVFLLFFLFSHNNIISKNIEKASTNIFVFEEIHNW